MMIRNVNVRKIAAASIMSVLPLFALAQGVDVSSCSQLTLVITRITNALAYIAILAAAIVVVIGAFYLVFSGGGDNAAKGRQFILYGLIGVAVALVAFSLPKLVGAILGGSPSCF